MDNLIAKIHQNSKTVFNMLDLALIWSETDRNRLKAKTAYYVKQGVLIRLTRGIFAKSKDYNAMELANSISSPSYISFETALRAAGMIFQHYDTIFVAAKWSKTVEICGKKFVFRKMKTNVLYNPQGIENRGNYSIAGPNRAFLDMIYLFPDFYFDNLLPVDWEECFETVKIYQNKRLEKRLAAYQKKYAE
jgi:predicted transcriptional regulator of viral defense system